MATHVSRHSPDTAESGVIFRYRVFGLSMAANHPIAGLARDAGDAAVDVRVDVRHDQRGQDPPGSVDVLLENTAHHVSGRPLLRISVARLDGSHLLEHGSGLTCVIDRAGRSLAVFWPPRLTEDPWEFALGFASAYLLRLRGVVSLHAASVMHAGEALLLAGPSGVGKSMLAAALTARGCSFITDDVAAVGCENGRMVVQPGPATLRPRRSAIEALRMVCPGPAWWSPSAERDCLEIDPIGLGSYEASAVAETGAVYILTPRVGHAGVTLDSVAAAEAAVTLIGDTWVGRVNDPKIRAKELDQVSRVIGQGGAFRLTYDPEQPAWLSDAVSLLTTARTMS